MSRYAKGAAYERKIVNEHACMKDTVLVMRGAGSKCKGKIKVDVIVLSEDVNNPGWGKLTLIQCKKSKCSYASENRAFMAVKIPSMVKVERKFLQVS